MQAQSLRHGERDRAPLRASQPSGVPRVPVRDGLRRLSLPTYGAGAAVQRRFTCNAVRPSDGTQRPRLYRGLGPNPPRPWCAALRLTSPLLARGRSPVAPREVNANRAARALHVAERSACGRRDSARGQRSLPTGLEPVEERRLHATPCVASLAASSTARSPRTNRPATGLRATTARLRASPSRLHWRSGVIHAAPAATAPLRRTARRCTSGGST